MKLLTGLFCVLVLSGCRDQPVALAPEAPPEVLRVSVRYSDAEPAGLDIWLGERHQFAAVELTELYTVQSTRRPDGADLIGVGIYYLDTPWLAVFLAPPGGEVSNATGWVSADAEDAFDRFAHGEFVEETVASLAENSGFPEDARIRRVWTYDPTKKQLTPGQWRAIAD